jgi:hypothetical protein
MAAREEELTYPVRQRQIDTSKVSLHVLGRIHVDSTLERPKRLLKAPLQRRQGGHGQESVTDLQDVIERSAWPAMRERQPSDLFSDKQSIHPRDHRPKDAGNYPPSFDPRHALTSQIGDTDLAMCATRPCKTTA